MSDTLEFVRSWASTRGRHSLPELLDWVEELNRSTHVEIRKNRLSDSDTWFYDEENGTIHNQNNSFFSISGLQFRENGAVTAEQPILIQDEIGFLGILCQMQKGLLHFLMQAKIEPGNVNNIQISPTIQATKSNFTQQHGGRKPAYLEYFVEQADCTVIADQIQSEQSSRFLGKRNRNTILLLPEGKRVEAGKNFRWMTLGQIKALMRRENLVNMDTRTVLSCIPYAMYHGEEREELREFFRDKSLYSSIFEPKENLLPPVTGWLSQYRMFDGSQRTLVRLDELTGWTMTDEGIRCQGKAPFFVTYCDIAIEGREVQRWTQPLFEAEGKALFGLFTAVRDGRRLFLVKALAEAGCFDRLELAPTVQLEAGEEPENEIDRLFSTRYQAGMGVLYDVILSEEGGRFYHEENHNRILDIDFDAVPELPRGYFWLDYYTLNLLGQVNNCLNIQLRNLLSLLEV